jgi:hypothetical protein
MKTLEEIKTELIELARKTPESFFSWPTAEDIEFIQTASREELQIQADYFVAGHIDFETMTIH